MESAVRSAWVGSAITHVPKQRHAQGTLNRFTGAVGGMLFLPSASRFRSTNGRRQPMNLSRQERNFWMQRRGRRIARQRRRTSAETKRRQTNRGIPGANRPIRVLPETIRFEATGWWRRQSGETSLQRRNREFFEKFRPKQASDRLIAASQSNFDRDSQSVTQVPRHFPVIAQNRCCKRLNRSRDEQYQAFCNPRTGDSPQESRHLGRHHCLARFAGLPLSERRL